MNPAESTPRGFAHRRLEAVGTIVTATSEEVGRFFYILFTTLHWMFRRPFDFKEWCRQMVRVGVDSLPVVGLTAMFTCPDIFSL